MILTGARVSEACGLCWDAIDLDRGQLQELSKEWLGNKEIKSLTLRKQQKPPLQ